MKPLKTQISLRIQNNTNFSQPVEILSVIPSIYTANNSTKFYTFDLSTEDFVGITGVRVDYFIIPNFSGINSPVVPLTTLSIAGIVDALNTLGLGLFSYDGTTIYTTSNVYDFQDIVTL